MAFDNTTVVVGNVTRDPELRFSQGGTAHTNFGLAWNKRTRDGEDQTSFFDVVCFGSLAENVAESLGKGDRVVVYGGLQQRSWETQDGDRRSKVEIVADEVAPSLRWATTVVERNQRDDQPQRNTRQRSSGGRGRSDAPPAYDPDEEPF